MRKIIQIAFEVNGWIGDTNDHGEAYQVGGHTDSNLYALCDDGSIWILDENIDGKLWTALNVPQIPQD